MTRWIRLLAILSAVLVLGAACGRDSSIAAASDDEMPDDEMPDDGMADDMPDDDMADDMHGEQTFRVTLTNTSDSFAYAASGASAIPVGATEAGPAFPGSGYEFVVPRAASRLTIASMFVQSNDWFWSSGPEGIALVDVDGNPVSGDVTHEVSLWDAGTEADQTPGEGSDQAPRQAAPNTGEADPDPTVRAVDGFDATDYVRVVLTPNADGSTTVAVDNVGAAAAVVGPIAPVAWAVHGEGSALFTPGEAAPAGLESLAEDGSPAALASSLGLRTGTTTPFAPVAFVVSEDLDPIFSPGAVASAGLESLAEDGSPAALVPELVAAGFEHAGAATNPDGGPDAGPAFPTSSYTFEVDGEQGDRLSFVSMFVQSNDWFVAGRNLALFDADGVALSGDITASLGLYDAGTELDQAVAAGPDQAPRQAGPNTGAADPDSSIRPIDFDLAGHLVLTIEVIG